MYRNIVVEKARCGYTDEYLAEKLNMSRMTFCRKMKSGNFTVHECKMLMKLFGKPFNYLFESNEEINKNVRS